MTRNRSAALPDVTPNILYADVAGAMAWLQDSFGFLEHLRLEGMPGNIPHAQMRVGAGMIMLGQSSLLPEKSRGLIATQSVIVRVADVDALYAKARANGAIVRQPPLDQIFGERQCAFEDPEGHLWWFTQHIRDVAPEEWGASLKQAAATHLSDEYQSGC